MGRRYTLPCTRCNKVGGARFKVRTGRRVTHGVCADCAHDLRRWWGMGSPVEITLTHEQCKGPDGTPFVWKVK